MKRIAFYVSVTFFLALSLKAQNTPEDFGFREYLIFDEELDTIRFYISTKDSNNKKPVIVYLQGSGAGPLFYKYNMSDRGYCSVVCLQQKEIKDKYHLVLIGKPGEPFFKILEKDSTGRPLIEPTEKYNKLLTLDYRAKSTSMVIDYLTKQNWLDKHKIVVWGVSEGAQVAPKVAVLNDNVTHLICSTGSGLNQFYTFIINVRNDVAEGILSHIEGQAKIDSLYQIFKDIYNNAEATDGFWEGHTYLRWASFCKESAFDNVLKLDIPIYIAKGTADRNSPILHTDYIYLEFIKRGKKNLTYKVYPGYDHYFNEKIVEDGEVIETINHSDQVIDDALRWLENK